MDEKEQAKEKIKPTVQGPADMGDVEEPKHTEAEKLNPITPEG